MFDAVFTGHVDIPALGIDNATADIVTGPGGVERVAIGVDSANVRARQPDRRATFEIRQQPPCSGLWRLGIAGRAKVPGVVDALSIAGNLGADGTGTLDVSTGGELGFGTPGSTPVVSLSGATATIVRTTAAVSMSAAGAVTVLGVPLGFAGNLTVGSTNTTGTVTAATPASGVPFGAAIRTAPSRWSWRTKARRSRSPELRSCQGWRQRWRSPERSHPTAWHARRRCVVADDRRVRPDRRGLHPATLDNGDGGLHKAWDRRNCWCSGNRRMSSAICPSGPQGSPARSV